MLQPKQLQNSTIKVNWYMMLSVWFAETYVNEYITFFFQMNLKTFDAIRWMPVSF